MSMLEKALAASRAGFAVFPLAPGSKKPLAGSAGLLEATRDEAQIRAWWETNPDANIGIAAGDSLLIIDVDAHKGGEETLAALEFEHGLLPDTLTVNTPRGGRHLYFSVATPAPSTVERLGPGIDTRGQGGYVVGPSSVVDGKEYVGNTLHISDAPSWLLAKLGEVMQRRDDADKIADGLAWDEPGNVARATEWLRKEAATSQVAVEGEGGDSFTFRTAAVVRDFAVSQDKCFELMAEHWNPRCQPPWPEDELEIKVSNTYLYAKRPAGERCASPAGLAKMLAVAKIDRTFEAPTLPEPKSRFKLLTVAELSHGPPKWLIENTLVAESAIELYGQYGSYKSFLALDMALHLAAGLPWAGHKTIAARPVLYVPGEGSHGIGARIEAWLSEHGNAGRDNIRVSNEMPMFAEPNDLEDFARAIKDFRPALIVFDTFSRALAGLDENSAKDVNMFFARAEKLARPVAAAVMIVHHTGKDASKGSRGSNSIPASCDTIFETVLTSRYHATLTMEKQKDWSEWDKPQGFEAKVVKDSLVFHPARIQPTEDEVHDKLRFDNMVEILKETIDPIATMALAWEMAKRSSPNESDGTRKVVAANNKNWLNKQAREGSGAFKKLVHTWSAGRGVSHTFLLPKNELTTPVGNG